MNLALDLTKALLRADGLDWQNASSIDVRRAMTHAETSLLFIAQNLERYARMGGLSANEATMRSVEVLNGQTNE